jgi:hypothetical protein
MLIKTSLETLRDLTRPLAVDETITTVPVGRIAANAGRWFDGHSQALRLRRQRRMKRALQRMVGAWSVQAL